MERCEIPCKKIVEPGEGIAMELKSPLNSTICGTLMECSTIWCGMFHTQIDGIVEICKTSRFHDRNQ